MIESRLPNEKRVLPIKRPPIIGYAHHAFTLSIQPDNESFEQWYASHYIQLTCAKDLPENRETHLDFYWDTHYKGYYWLQIRKTNRDAFAKEHSNVIDYIISQINSGYYVVIYVDEYYISGRYSYQRTNHSHEILVYGYDNQNQLFDTSGYDHRGMYFCGQVAFSEISEGYECIELKDDNRFFNVYSIKCKTNSTYEVDQEEVKEQLYDYLHARNTFERQNKDRILFLSENMNNSIITNEHVKSYISKKENVFGMDVYIYVQQYLERLMNQNTAFDIRLIHILWEHKVCMLDRIIYFENRKWLNANDGLSRDYSEVKDIMEYVRKFMLKYKLTNDPKLIVRIIDYLQEVKYRERLIVERMLEKLSEDA